MYQTIKATVRKGRIELLEDISLPENVALLITVLEKDDMEALSIGTHLVGGLQDILSGNVTEVHNEADLSQHLAVVFQEEI